MSDVVSLRSVAVRRDGQTVLDQLDWTVREGEHWVVLGANGAGKTSVLQVAAGRLAPSSGQATVLGEVLPADDELRSRVGLVSAALAEYLPRAQTAREVVLAAAYGGIALAEPGSADELARADAVLRRLGCGRLAERRYGRLSDGERQRIQIARALYADPELLLLDEPSAGLDLGSREALLRHLTRLVRDPAGPVLVLVTHRVEEIPVGVTHGLVLRAGRVAAAGPLESVLTDPVLTAAFGFPLRVDRLGDRWAARAAV